MAKQGTKVARPSKTQRLVKEQRPLDGTKAHMIMSSAEGVEHDDHQRWSASRKLQWIERFQRQGVSQPDAKGVRKPEKIHIFFEGVDTVDIDTGEIVTEND